MSRYSGREEKVRAIRSLAAGLLIASLLMGLSANWLAGANRAGEEHRRIQQTYQALSESVMLVRRLETIDPKRRSEAALVNGLINVSWIRMSFAEEIRAGSPLSTRLGLIDSKLQDLVAGTLENRPLDPSETEAMTTVTSRAMEDARDMEIAADRNYSLANSRFQVLLVFSLGLCAVSAMIALYGPGFVLKTTPEQLLELPTTTMEVEPKQSAIVMNFELATGLFLGGNAALSEVLGIEERKLHEWRERFIDTYIHPEDRRRFRRFLSDVGTPETLVFRLFTASGRSLWFSGHDVVTRRGDDGRATTIARIALSLDKGEYHMPDQALVLAVAHEADRRREEADRLKELELLNQSLASERKRLEAEAQTDSLTGLANHGACWDFLRRQVEHNLVPNAPLSVIMFDLDDFKRVNDQFGHLEGDRVLMEVGQSVRPLIRATDLAGRYGGEEFLIICPFTGLEEARMVAERLKGAVGTIRTEGGRIAASFGVACSIGRIPPEELVEEADRCLYEAKSRGGNRVVESLILDPNPDPTG